MNIKNKILYVAKDYENIFEGGASRDKAFFDFIKNNNYEIYKLNCNNRFLTMLNIIFKLFLVKDRIILFHMSGFLFIFPAAIYQNKFMQMVLKAIFKYISLKNRIIIDINDLQYEQAIDLDLKYNLKKILKMQKQLLNIDKCEYIFASETMKEFAEKNYIKNKNKNKNYVCINGAIELREKNKERKIRKKIRFIYAGTLNKGRDIEKMIENFQDTSLNSYLILIGTEGEWLKGQKYKNVCYFGSLNEEQAMQLTSKCDIGIIPYSSEKLYYNICYPTKVSFYLSAGIPILMENLFEILRHIKKDKLFILNKEAWQGKIKNIKREDIEEKKNSIVEIKSEFLWENLLDSLFKEIINKR